MEIKDLQIKIKGKKEINLTKILEIRTYIPIAEKRVVLETILNKCCTVEDGVVVCDYILMKMMFELAMIKYHTNLEVDITSEDDYDEIKKIGIDFHNEYASDYEECQLLFDGIKQELYSRYSIETSVVNLSNKLSENIGSVASSLAQKIKNIDVSKFGFEGLEFDKFKNLINKYGK